MNPKPFGVTKCFLSYVHVGPTSMVHWYWMGSISTDTKVLPMLSFDELREITPCAKFFKDRDGRPMQFEPFVAS
jgi:hypothetical protein